MTRREWALTAIVALSAGAAGYGYHFWRGADQRATAQSSDAIMAAQLPDLDGKLEPLEQWRGRVLVVNFWATWCAPCREEIPVFVRLQDRYRDRGLQFVGVAIDQPQKVRPYAAELGMNFPVLIGDVNTVDLTRALGNRAGVLPFTVILGRSGSIAATQVGALNEAKLEPLLTSLL